MLGQDFLIESVEELIDINETEDSLKAVSRSSLIPVTNFPSVIIEDNGFDYSQETGKDDILTRKEGYNIAVIVKSVNTNELTEVKYKDVTKKIDDLSENVVAKIIDKAQTHEKISNIKFGRGEKFDGTISSVPVMWNMIPVEVIMVSN